MPLIFSGAGTITGINAANGLSSPQTGSVLQVVNATLGAVDVATSSSTFVTSGLYVTITPKFSTSKILLMLNGGGQYNSGAGNTIWTTIYRDATNLGDANYGLSRLYSGALVIMPHSINFVDLPATTSATTYTCYYRANAGGSVQFQSTDRGTISFTAMEIAA